MKLRVIILFAIAGLAACHRHPGNAPAPPAKPQAGAQPAVAPNQGPNPQQSTADMVEAVAQGKSASPRRRSSSICSQRPVQGQPLEVAIALLPQIGRPLGHGRGDRLGRSEDRPARRLRVPRGRGRPGLPAQHQSDADDRGILLADLVREPAARPDFGLARLLRAHSGRQRRRQRLGSPRRGTWCAAGRRGTSRILKEIAAADAKRR